MPHLLHKDGLGSISRPHGKPDVVARICDSSTPVGKWSVEVRVSWELLDQLAWSTESSRNDEVDPASAGGRRKPSLDVVL